MKVGIAKSMITPPVKGKILAVRHELYAKALVLEDEGNKVVLVTADIALFGKDAAAAIREKTERLTGIPGSHIMMAASHNHSCANTTMLNRWRGLSCEPDEHYFWYFVDRITGMIFQATQNLLEARIGAGKGNAKLNINRWIQTPEGAKWAPNPDAPDDPDVSVLRIDDVSGVPLAILVNFAAHASVLTWGKYISADFPGYLQDAVEKLYDGRVEAFFVNGASGDLKVNWLKTGNDGKTDFVYCSEEAGARRIGYAIAGEAVKVFELTETTSLTGVSVFSTTVSFPLLSLPNPAEVTKELEDRRRNGTERPWDADWAARIIPELENGSMAKTVEGEIQCIGIGGKILLLALPGEVFVEIGLRLKRMSPVKDLFVVGYANGYAGYLASDKSLREDGDTPRYDWHRFFWYPSCFAEGTEQVIIDAAAQLFQQVVEKQQCGITGK
ncbi:MAG: neutral/alkaline non-lysosomal ceramidase N-terminal domain-containing protein [Lentisphaeria bacterium]